MSLAINLLLQVQVKPLPEHSPITHGWLPKVMNNGPTILAKPKHVLSWNHICKGSPSHQPACDWRAHLPARSVSMDWVSARAAWISAARHFRSGILIHIRDITSTLSPCIPLSPSILALLSTMAEPTGYSLTIPGGSRWTLAKLTRRK